VSADNAVAQARIAPAQRADPAPEDFADFFREHYRTLVRTAMYAGATPMEADEATQMTMGELLSRWAGVDDPLAYGRHAVVNTFVKTRTRGLDRLRVRQIRRTAAGPPAHDSPALTLWEDREWVIQLLDSLPREQRTVMACVVDGFKTAEIADLLGRSSDAVRQSLREARIRLRRALEAERAAESEQQAKEMEGR
jgi:RNA polymerase sigma factor (sigma-70 family)